MNNLRGVPQVLVTEMQGRCPHHPSAVEAKVGLNVLTFTQQYDFYQDKMQQGQTDRSVEKKNSNILKHLLMKQMFQTQRCNTHVGQAGAPRSTQDAAIDSHQMSTLLYKHS